MSEKCIAIITARSGSKRIPKKNIREFCGKPIIQYSIEAAIKSGEFDEVMVSTDSKEIADIAEHVGASVPFFRSEKASDDYATTVDVIYEVLNEYKKMGRNFENGVCIYPTAPFVTAKKLKEVIRLLKYEDAYSVLPVVQYSFPPQRSVVIKDGRIAMLHPEYANTRSQDLNFIYHDCGQFYAFKVDIFLKQKKLVGDNTVPYVLDELEVQDIDNYSDWKIAEMKYRLMVERNTD